MLADAAHEEEDVGAGACRRGTRPCQPVHADGRAVRTPPVGRTCIRGSRTFGAVHEAFARGVSRTRIFGSTSPCNSISSPKGCRLTRASWAALFDTLGMPMGPPSARPARSRGSRARRVLAATAARAGPATRRSRPPPRLVGAGPADERIELWPRSTASWSVTSSRPPAASTAWRRLSRASPRVRRAPGHQRRGIGTVLMWSSCTAPATSAGRCSCCWACRLLPPRFGFEPHHGWDHLRAAGHRPPNFQARPGSTITRRGCAAPSRTGWEPE